MSLISRIDSVSWSIDLNVSSQWLYEVVYSVDELLLEYRCGNVLSLGDNTIY